MPSFSLRNLPFPSSMAAPSRDMQLCGMRDAIIRVIGLVRSLHLSSATEAMAYRECS